MKLKLISLILLILTSSAYAKDEYLAVEARLTVFANGTKMFRIVPIVDDIPKGSILQTSVNLITWKNLLVFDRDNAEMWVKLDANAPKYSFFRIKLPSPELQRFHPRDSKWQEK